jgi:hypothetical protein
VKGASSRHFLNFQNEMRIVLASELAYTLPSGRFKYFKIVTIQKWCSTCSGFTISNEAIAWQLPLLCLHSVAVLRDFPRVFPPSHFGARRPGIFVPKTNGYTLLSKCRLAGVDELRKCPRNNALQVYNIVTLTYNISCYLNCMHPVVYIYLEYV